MKSVLMVIFGALTSAVGVSITENPLGALSLIFFFAVSMFMVENNPFKNKEIK